MAAAAALMVLAGCASAAPSPEAGGENAPGHSKDFAKLLRECLVVNQNDLATVTGEPDLVENFSGAICRWSNPGNTTAVTLNWFEHGSMKVEKDTAQRLGFEVENQKLDGSVVYVTTDPQNPSACGVTSKASDQGIIGWWVDGSAVDPCKAALDLTALSLNRAF